MTAPAPAAHPLRATGFFIDADDTLWENAVYFDRARDGFTALLAAHGCDAAGALAALEVVEARHVARGWFGSRRLASSMLETAQALAPERAADICEELAALWRAVFDHPIRLHACVVPALAELRRTHPLRLVTMGDPEEQLAKLERSGLRGFFTAIEVLPDKTAEAYAGIVRCHGLDPTTTWMVGNSRAKDIDPAGAAGLRTVLVRTVDGPHFGRSAAARTPDLEIGGLAELPAHFRARE
jgi:putative hydrolase of the HAD superfamily